MASALRFNEMDVEEKTTVSLLSAYMRVELWSAFCRFHGFTVNRKVSSNAGSASVSSRLPSIKMCAVAAAAAPAESKKTVWLWTENRQVMTTAVERGWTTFLFGSRDLGKDWSCENNVFPSFGSVQLDEMSVFDGPKPYEIDSGDPLLTVFNWFPATARINPLFIDGLDIFDGENKKVAAISQVSSPRELELIQPDNIEAKNVVIDFRGGWQVIPAENIVAAFQGYRGAVLAVSTTQQRLKFSLR
ncbi:hypothetical protein PR202_gb18720 [Eleusine coracana subsp. coracana]|uniref:3-dehydroquinate synthase N-terminal domain-containing protein n=1 Tax=Eleusine coracana subsp. coracana TaxID=191504 RepID=A0AAV5F7R2_ELECO|nr:hypothetical protein PR202_gb18720 [Eleusine coracana subsp. coracana]